MICLVLVPKLISNHEGDQLTECRLRKLNFLAGKNPPLAGGPNFCPYLANSFYKNANRYLFKVPFSD